MVRRKWKGIFQICRNYYERVTNLREFTTICNNWISYYYSIKSILKYTIQCTEYIFFACFIWLFILLIYIVGNIDAHSISLNFSLCIINILKHTYRIVNMYNVGIRIIIYNKLKNFLKHDKMHWQVVMFIMKKKINLIFL